MKYFIILTASLLFFFGSIVTVFFLWELEQEWTWKALMIFCPTFAGFLLIRNLRNYFKIQLNKNVLQVSKLLSSKTYDLNDLSSWTEETNLYRVSYRKLILNFQNDSLTLIDHSDQVKYLELYHYLMTKHNSHKIQP
jgi:hypothetical protein